MLRINLLPVGQLRKRRQAKGELSVFSLLAAFLVVVAAVFSVIQLREIVSLRKEIAQLEIEKKSLESQRALLEQLIREQKELGRKTTVIENLQQESSLTARVMDEVAKAVDNSRLWLEAMAETGGKVELKGIALDNESIAQFMDNLKSSPFVQDVSLVESSQKLLAGRDLKSFTISCQVAPPTKEKTNDVKNPPEQ
jgi:type IV pilus assembly protein PilN